MPNVFKPLMLLLLMLGVSFPVFGQNAPPKFLLGATHCLLTGNWLSPGKSKAASLDLGYFLDTTSYPGQKALYVVSYIGHSRAEGFVYTVFLEREKARQVFNIQNNAKFVRSYKEGAAFRKEGVNFVEDPLWGIWTQEHIARAIQRIGDQPTFSVTIKNILQAGSRSECRSYVDDK